MLSEVISNLPPMPIPETSSTNNVNLTEQILLANKDKWRPDTIAYCVMLNDIASIKLLMENGCPNNEWATRLAAKEGNYELLRYLIAHGCPWDQFTVNYAAWGGNTDCFDYLISIGGQIKLSTRIYAMIGGNDHLLRKRRAKL